MTVTSAATVRPARREVIGRADQRWQRLRQIVDERSLMRGDFILTSGKTSKFLFQLRQTTMFPEGQFLIGSIIEEYMRANGLRSVGGLDPDPEARFLLFEAAAHRAGRGRRSKGNLLTR